MEVAEVVEEEAAGGREGHAGGFVVTGVVVPEVLEGGVCDEGEDFGWEFGLCARHHSRW